MACFAVSRCALRVQLLLPNSFTSTEIYCTLCKAAAPPGFCKAQTGLPAPPALQFGVGRQTDRQPWRGLRVPFQLFCLPETESFGFGIVTKRSSFLWDEQIPVCYCSESAQNYLFYIWEWILGMAMTLFMWLCRVSHTYGCCVCPRGSLDSVSVLLWQLRVPGLLLSSCSGWGRSRGSLGWVLLSGFTSSALVSPLRSVNDLGKLDWEHRELSPVRVHHSSSKAARGPCVPGCSLAGVSCWSDGWTRGCMFLGDKLNFPLLIACNMTSGVSNKPSSCAAARASPNDPGGEGSIAWGYQMMLR